MKDYKIFDELFIIADQAESNKQYKKAFSIFFMLAKYGYSEGMIRMACMYSDSKFLRQNLDGSLQWDIKAFQQGYGSLKNISATYRMMGDLQAAKHFLHKALESGDESAALTLAKFYHLSKKEDKRVKHLLSIVINSQIVSEYDYEEAQEILEYMDKKKKTSVKNIVQLGKAKVLDAKSFNSLIEAEINFYTECYEDAFKQFKKLAKQQSCEAMHYLGYMFQYGLGVKQAYKNSIKWYKQAIEYGSVDSLMNLAIVYRCTVKVDLYQSYLEQAKKNGVDRAVLLLAKLYNFSEKEKLKVKKLLREIINSKTATVDLIYEAKVLLEQL